MDALPELNLTKILEGFYRRKTLIIAVFAVVSSLAAYLAVTLPPVYKSSSLILITPQKVPPSYINSTVTSTIQERINAMIQEILSRTRLEKIVNEFNLYPPSGPGVTMEDRVERFRKNIGLDIRGTDAFQVSFQSESPERAMQVANRLGSLFIEENLQIREQQAMGTTVFISTEAERLRKELEEQENQVTRFKTQYRFELQLDANLRTLDQLRSELQGNNGRLATLKERKANLEKQIVEAETMAPEVGRARGSDGGQGMARWQEIEARRAQLAGLRLGYSEKHPDVIRLTQEIRALEAGESAEKSRSKKSGPGVVGSIGNPVRQMLLSQVADLNSEIKSLQSINEGLQGNIASYQTRVDNTPLREIELSKISRTYDITLRKYQDLLAKGLESQLSENMEKKQKGEQFRIIDPANFPQKPLRPNRQFILLLGLLAGLAGGFGLAFLLENLDTSFKRSDELEAYFNVPLLATIPAVITRGSILAQRRAQAVLVLGSAVIMVVGMVWIRFFGPSYF